MVHPLAQRLGGDAQIAGYLRNGVFLVGDLYRIRLYAPEHERETKFGGIGVHAVGGGLYPKASDPVLRTHLLMVRPMSLGDPIREVARMVGYSEKRTREVARRYESEGVEEGLGERRHGQSWS